MGGQGLYVPATPTHQWGRVTHSCSWNVGRMLSVLGPRIKMRSFPYLPIECEHGVVLKEGGVT